MYYVSLFSVYIWFEILLPPPNWRYSHQALNGVSWFLWKTQDTHRIGQNLILTNQINSCFVMNFKQFKFHSHLFILRQVYNLSWCFQGHHTVYLQLCDSPTLCFGDTGESKWPFHYIIFRFAIISNGLFYTCIYDIQIHSVNSKSILISSQYLIEKSQG